MTTQKRIDQFANRIAARLEGGGVPHDVSERLRIARQQALAAHKTAATSALQPSTLPFRLKSRLTWNSQLLMQREC